jgi:hypothetical protein
MLNVKQGGAIFNLILDNDTDSLKADVVLLNSMAELLCEAIEVLDPSIQGLMACSSSSLTLKLS